MKTIAFFTNSSGAGKTHLVYHLAWMFSDLGHNVLAADLDPQSILSSTFLKDPELEVLWPDAGPRRTIFGGVDRLLNNVEDTAADRPVGISENLSLIAGDPRLAGLEQRFSEAWSNCLADGGRAGDGLRVTTVFCQVIQVAAASVGSQYVFMDLGPNLGSVNRAALIAADFLVIPLASDMYSAQALRSLGPALREWRAGWRQRRSTVAATGLSLPLGEMSTLGYILIEPSMRENLPYRAPMKWVDIVPRVYAQEMAEQEASPISDGEAQHRLFRLRRPVGLDHYARDARKPIFDLSPADGAFGGYAAAVQDCKKDFKTLAKKIMTFTGGEPKRPLDDD